MAKIDELVLTMKFDNAKFKSAARETLDMLNNLKSGLKLGGIKDAFKGSAKSAGVLASEVQKIDMSKLAGDVSSVQKQFSLLGTVGRTALGKLTVDAINAGKQITNAISKPLVEGGFKRAQNIEDAEFMLKGLGADVQKTMEAANHAVLGTAYGLDEAAKAASQFYASGLTNYDEMGDALLGISGVAAMTSSSYEEIANIFTTVSGQGKIMSHQLNQFASRGLNVAATLADYFGTTEASVREMVTESKVSFEDFYKAMNQAYGEHAKKAGETYKGAMANMKAPLARMGADVAGPYMKEMTKLFNAMKPMLDYVHTAAKPMIDIINNGIAGGVSKTIGLVDNLTNKLKSGIGINAEGQREIIDGGWVTSFYESVKKFGSGFQHIKEQFLLFADSINRSVWWQWTRHFEGALPLIDRIANGFNNLVSKLKFSDLFLYNNAKIFAMLFEIINFGVYAVKTLAGGLASIGIAIGQYLGPPITHFIRFAAEAVRLTLEWFRSTRILEGGVKVITTVIVGLIRGLGAVLSFIARMVDGVLITFQKLRDGELFSWLPKLNPKPVERISDAIRNLGRWLNSIKTAGLEKIVIAFDFLKVTVGEVAGVIKEFVRTIDFTWLAKSFEWIKNLSIGNPFEDVDLSGFNLDGATKSVKSWGTNLRKAISSGEGVSMGGIFEPVKNFWEYLRGLDWGGVMGRIGDGVSSGVKGIAKAFAAVYESISSYLSDVDWHQLGANIVEKIVQGLTMIKDVGVKIGDFLKESISSAIEAIDFGAMWDNVKDFGSGIKDAIGELFGGVKEEVDETVGKTKQLDAKVDVEVKTSGLDKLNEIENLKTGGFVQKIKNITEAIGDLLKSAGGEKVDGSRIFDVFGENIGKGLKSFTSNLGKGIKFLTNPVQTLLTNTKTALTTGISTFATDIISAIGNAFTSFGDFILKYDIAGFANAIGLAFTGLGFFKMANSISAFTDAIAGIPASISGLIDSLKDSITGFSEAAKIEAKGNFILKLAAAIGILALSLWGLSQLSWSEIGKGLLTLGILLGALIGTVLLLDKFLSKDAAGKLSGVGAALMSLAIAMGVMAASIWLLGNMDPQTLIQGLGTIIGLVLTLATGSLIANAAGPIKGLGGAFLGLATGLLVLAFALMMFKAINWPEIIKGLVTVTGILAGMALAGWLSGGASLAGIGKAMLGVGLGLMAIILAIKMMSDLDGGEIAKGLMLIVGVLTPLTVAARLGGSALPALAGTLMGIAAALLAMALAIRILEGVDFWTMVGSMTVLVGGIIGLALAIRMLPPGELAKLGTMFIGLGAGMLVLAAAIWLLGQMEWDTIVKGLTVMAVALGGIALVAFAMSKNAAGLGGAIKMALMLGTLAGGLMLIAIAVRMFESIDWNTMVKAGAALGALLLAMAAFAGLATLMQGIAGGLLLAVGVMLAVAGTMLILGEAVQKFADVDWGALGRAGVALLGLVAAVGALAAIGSFGGPGLLMIGAFFLLVSGSAWIAADALDRITGALERFSEIGDELKSSLTAAGEGITAFADEAKDGLNELLDIAKDSNWNQLGKLGKLLGDIFGNIESGSGDALKGAAEGLVGFSEAIPNLKELIEVGDKVGLGDASGLGNLFKALSELEPHAGESLAGVADGLAGFSDAIPNLLELIEVGDKVGLGDASGLGNLFKAFTHLDPETGPSLDAMVGPLERFSEVTDTLKSISEVGNDTDWNSGSSIGGLFKALNQITPETGTNIDAVIEPMRRFGDIMEILGEFSGVANDTDWNSGMSIGGLFGALNKITPETGPNIDALVGPLTNFGDSLETLGKVVELGAGIEWGDNRSVGGLFNALNKITPETGTNLSGLSTALSQLDDVIPVLNSLMDFSVDNKGDFGKLKGLFNTLGSIDADVGDNLTSAADGIREFQDSTAALSSAMKSIENMDTGKLKTLMDDLKSAFSDGFSSGVEDAASAVSGMVDSLVSAITDTKDRFKTAGGELGTEIGAGIEDKKETIKGKARSAAEAGASAIKEKKSAWNSAGKALADGMAQGIRSGQEGAVGAARALAAAVTAAAKVNLSINSPSRVFAEIGRYVSEGLAQGIDQNAGLAADSSSNMAQSTIDNAADTLEINSPSRKFYELGAAITEGFTNGIIDGSHLPAGATEKMLDAIINIVQGKGAEINEAGESFYDVLLKGFNDNPVYHRMDKLMRHAMAKNATNIKEKRIKDEEEAERREDEREKVYRDVEDAREAIRDSEERIAKADENAAEVEDSKEKSKDAAADRKKADKDRKKAEDDRKKAARDRDKAKRDLADNEKKYRRAIAARDRYEYEQYGEEAGVAFIDGVAVGLIDESDRIPTVFEVISEVFMEEVDRLKKEGDNFVGVFDGIRNFGKGIKNASSHLNEFRRAIIRTGHAMDPDAFGRNLVMAGSALIDFAGEMVDLMAIFDKFEPYLPMLFEQFDRHLPAIIPIVAQYAPALASTLGGGIAAALPAIAGPVGAVAAAVIGGLALIYDSGAEQKVIKFLRSIVHSFVEFLKNLPHLISKTIITLVTGIGNIIKEIPMLIKTLVVGLVDAVIALVKALPEIIPEIIIAIVEAIVAVLIETPTLLVDIVFALFEAILRLIFEAIPELIMRLPQMFWDIGVAIVEGIRQGVNRGYETLKGAIMSPFVKLGNGIERLFGIKSPSRYTREIGQYLMEGLALGVDGGADGAINAVENVSHDILSELDRIIAGIEETIAVEMNPTITPVVDMSDVEASMNSLEDRVLNFDRTADNAFDLDRMDREGLGIAAGNTTVINYTQNNTSPEPLDAITIYRNTQRQLDNMK